MGQRGVGWKPTGTKPRPLVEGQRLLDLSNSLTRVQPLWTSLGAVHDGVASVQGHRVLQHLLSHGGSLVSGVNQPSVRLHQHGWSQILLLVPPVRWTGGGATRTQNALVQPIQLLTVGNGLQVLSSVSRNAVSLQVRLDGLVLLVEVRQVRHQVSDHVHVWQRVDLQLLRGVRVDAAQTRQGVLTPNVHGTRAANSLSARSSQGQGGILLILDLQERIQHHWATLVQINLIVLQHRLLLRLVGVPTVNTELLHTLGRAGCGGQGAGWEDSPGELEHGGTEHGLLWIERAIRETACGEPQFL